MNDDYDIELGSQEPNGNPIKIIKDPRDDPFWKTERNPLRIQLQRIIDMEHKVDQVPLLGIQENAFDKDKIDKVFIFALDLKGIKIQNTLQLNLSQAELDNIKSVQMNYSSNFLDIKDGYDKCSNKFKHG